MAEKMFVDGGRWDSGIGPHSRRRFSCGNDWVVHCDGEAEADQVLQDHEAMEALRKPGVWMIHGPMKGGDFDGMWDARPANINRLYFGVRDNLATAIIDVAKVLAATEEGDHD